MGDVEAAGRSTIVPVLGKAAGVRRSVVRCEPSPPVAFSTAFQPIVDLADGRIFAFEALARGPAGEPAATVLSQIAPGDVGAFDQASCRRAIELACARGLIAIGARLAVNLVPSSTRDPACCLEPALAAARRTSLDPSLLIFEMVEHERFGDPAPMREIFRLHRSHGIRNAFDDFGAGHSGLVLLAEIEPDILKLDMALTRGIESSARRRSIVASMVGLCRELGVRLIAEGIETRDEAAALRALGIDLMQGYLFGRPAFEQLEPPML